MFGSKEGGSCVGNKVRHPRNSCIAFLCTKVLGAFPRPGASDAPETKIHISDHSVRQQGSSRTPRITYSKFVTNTQRRSTLILGSTGRNFYGISYFCLFPNIFLLLLYVYKHCDDSIKQLQLISCFCNFELIFLIRQLQSRFLNQTASTKRHYNLID